MILQALPQYRYLRGCRWYVRYSAWLPCQSRFLIEKHGNVTHVSSDFMMLAAGTRLRMP